MMYKTLTRAAGLAIALLLLGGWGMAAHAQAQVCYSANCMMRLDEANDPAYQAAIHGGWYPYSAYPYPYSYSYPYSFNYSPYQYQAYQDYSYQYQYQYGYSY